MAPAGLGGSRVTRPRSTASAAAPKKALKQHTSAAAAAAGAAETTQAADLLLGPLEEEVGLDPWLPHRFPFDCCPLEYLEAARGESPEGPEGGVGSASAYSTRKLSSRVGNEGLYVLQLCCLPAAALECLSQHLQQEQQQHGSVFPAAASSAVYVHPVSLKVHLLRPERPLPFLDVLVVGAPFREGPRGVFEQQQLATAIQGAPNLSALVIRGDGRWLQRLAAACSKSKSLSRLIIEDVRGACRSAKSSASSSSASTSSASSASAVVGLYVKTVAAMANSRSVCLRGCELGLGGLTVLVQQLHKHAALLRRLRELDLSFNGIPEEGGSVLADFLFKGKVAPLLQQLRLGGNSWGPRALEGRLKAWSLKELALGGAQGLGPPPLQGAGSESLGALWLASSDVSVRVLRRLLLQQTAAGSLLYLDLSCCGKSLTEADVAVLLEALYGGGSSSIAVQSSGGSGGTSRNKRTKRGSAAATRDTVRSPGPPLRSLNLSSNGFGPAVMPSIGEALTSPRCRLKALDLSGNPCGAQTAALEEGALPLQPLVDALQGVESRSPCSLECLFLKDCSIAALDQLELASALLLNQGRLKLLDIRGNGRCATGVAAKEDGSAAAAAQGRSKRARGSSSSSSSSATTSSAGSSSSKEMSDDEEAAEQLHSGGNANGRRNGRLRSSRRGARTAATSTRRAATAAEDSFSAGPLPECRQKGRSLGCRRGGGPPPRTGAARPPADELSLGSGETSLLSDITDSNDSYSDSSSFDEAACSAGSSEAEGSREQPHPRESGSTSDATAQDAAMASATEEASSSSDDSEYREPSSSRASASPAAEGAFRGGAPTGKALAALEGLSSSSDAEATAVRGGKRKGGPQEGPPNRRRRQGPPRAPPPQAEEAVEASGAPSKAAISTESAKNGALAAAAAGAFCQGGPSQGPISVVAEAGRIGAGRDRRGSARGLGLPQPGGASLSPLRAVKALAPSLTLPYPVGGGPFQIYFGMRRGSPSSSSAPPLPPLPSDPETQQHIKQALEELGYSLLRSFVGRESHRFICCSPLFPLLRGPPQCVLLGLKLLYFSGLSELSMADLSMLQQLQQSSSTSPMLRLLLSLLLEEFPLSNPTYKYAATGALDTVDLLCLPGVLLYDGGPNCPATSAAEFRVLWERKHNGSCSINSGRTAAATSAGPSTTAPSSLKRDGGLKGPPANSVFDLLPPAVSCRRPPVSYRGEAPAAAAATTRAAHDPPFCSPQTDSARRSSSSQQPKDVGGHTGAPLFATPAPLNRMKRPPPSVIGGLPFGASCGSLDPEALGACAEGGGAPAVGGGPSMRGFSVDAEGEGSDGTPSRLTVSPGDSRAPPLVGPPSAFSSVSSCSAFPSQQPQEQLVYCWEDADWLRAVERCLGGFELQGASCSSRGSQGGPCCCREVLVVDVQTDGALRRRVSEAQQMVLCDSVGIPCRLMRGSPGSAGAAEFVYNVVVVGSGQEAELEHLIPIVWGDGSESTEGGAFAEGASVPPFLQLNPPVVSCSPCSGVACCSSCAPPKPCGSTRCIHLGDQEQQQQQQQQQQRQKLAAERDLDRFLLQCAKNDTKPRRLLWPLASGSGVGVDLDLDFFFLFHEKLGKGNFGEVWRVSLKPQAIQAANNNPHHTRSTASSSCNRSTLKGLEGDDCSAAQHLPQYALKLVPRRYISRSVDLPHIVVSDLLLKEPS
ncbi:uncharacterized protein LOC113146637 [Cyclospora cayetanensis]|uniref:Uncharacterized protein LOC113146637 n=1 Tax=Cyclospora cayetanensis TaxID=88456 RepID=A0A6P6RRH9_9EIME|nr:uncharacterized protein LOC113146637 [Cyclospora cayetanensis]